MDTINKSLTEDEETINRLSTWMKDVVAKNKCHNVNNNRLTVCTCMQVLGHIDDDPQKTNKISDKAGRETAKYMIRWRKMKLKERRAWI
eukprot:4200271-Ditylum_brightwellii.AAC.1